MKLLFDATELSYCKENEGHKAGVYYVANNLLKELLKEDIEITLCCDYRRINFLKELQEFKDLPLIEEQSIINKFAGWLFYKTNKFPHFFKYGLIILGRIYDKYLYKVNKKNLEQLKDFDVYFSPFTPPSKEIETADLKRFRIIHDTIPIVENGISKSPINWSYKVYNSLNETDYYTTDSVSTKNDVLKYFPLIKETHIKTIYLGANENFYQEKNNNNNEKYIFSLCTLGKRKNIIFAIRNFFRFIEEYNIKDLKLILGGAIWEKYKKKLNKELNKYDRSKVILTGYIPEEELRKYYSNALCFIYPSLYEGFGLPVLEAMQCGCPVITSDRSSLPEVIGECGIKINPECDNDMISAYKQMYYDEDLRSECIEKGLERAKQFSWEKCAKEIIEFINTSIK